MDTQRTARVFGWLFIATFITGIGARLLFVNGLGATWENMRFIPGGMSETSMYLGAILEFGVIVTNIGTAVVLYPIVRRQSESVALGYVTARIVECTFILIGLISLISAVSVSSALAAPPALRQLHWPRRAVRSCLPTNGHSCSVRVWSWGSATA